MDMLGFSENTAHIPLGRFADGIEGAHAIDVVTGFEFWRVREGWYKSAATFLPASSITASLLYVSDGDTNGVFYYIGTNYGAGSWTNPFTASRLGITSTDNTGGDLKATIVDRTASAYSTSTNGNTAGIVFDLGVDKTLLLTSYSYRYRNDVATFAPTAWKVQGSNDNSTWTDLDTTTGQTPALSAWVSRTITATTNYRYFRLLMTGNNNNGGAQLSIGEFELYGVLSL